MSPAGTKMLDDVSSLLKSSVKKSPIKGTTKNFQLEPETYDYKLPDMPGVPGSQMSKDEETMIHRLRTDRHNRETRLRVMREEEEEKERARIKNEKEMEDAAARGNYHIEPNSKLLRFHDVNCGGLPVVMGKQVLREKFKPPEQNESIWWLKANAKIFKSKIKKAENDKVLDAKMAKANWAAELEKQKEAALMKEIEEQGGTKPAKRK